MLVLEEYTSQLMGAISARDAVVLAVHKTTDIGRFVMC